MKARRTPPQSIDARLARAEALLSQPLPSSLAAVAETQYAGPHEGLVNGLIWAALRVARGAVEDGATMAVLMATPYMTVAR